MCATQLAFDHVVSLNGRDLGPARVEVGPSGEIWTVRPGRRSDPARTSELTAIPLLADAHAHLAISDGVTDDVAFHTLERVDAQLRHLAVRGIGHILSRGTDQRWRRARLRPGLARGTAAKRLSG